MSMKSLKYLLFCTLSLLQADNNVQEIISPQENSVIDRLLSEQSFDADLIPCSCCDVSSCTICKKRKNIQKLIIAFFCAYNYKNSQVDSDQTNFCKQQFPTYQDAEAFTKEVDMLIRAIQPDITEQDVKKVIDAAHTYKL
jgi:hypothetical protein